MPIDPSDKFVLSDSDIHSDYESCISVIANGIHGESVAILRVSGIGFEGQEETLQFNCSEENLAKLTKQLMTILDTQGERSYDFSKFSLTSWPG